MQCKICKSWVHFKNKLCLIETCQCKITIYWILLPLQKLYTIEKTLTFSNSEEGVGVVHSGELRGREEWGRRLGHGVGPTASRLGAAAAAVWGGLGSAGGLYGAKEGGGAVGECWVPVLCGRARLSYVLLLSPGAVWKQPDSAIFFRWVSELCGAWARLSCQYWVLWLYNVHPCWACGGDSVTLVLSPPVVREFDSAPSGES